MKILHIVEPFSSGIITFIINLTSAMPQHQHVVLHGNRATADEIEKVRMRFTKDVSFMSWNYAKREVNPLSDVFALVELMTILKKNPVDIIHLHSAKAGFLGRVACAILRIDHVIYTPNSAPFSRTDIGDLKKRLFLFLEKIASKMSGKVITCGNSEFELYKSVGIYSKYINNGITIDGIRKEGSENEVKKADTIKIGFAGIATEQKSPKLFSDIAKEFILNSKIKFKWIGDGPLRNLLQSENIEITGWLKEDVEVKKHLGSIDIFLSTSQWEGQPFAVLEAMRYEKPLVLFDCVGNRDLVENGKNGYLFKTESDAVEKLQLLVANKEFRESLGKSSKEMCVQSHDIKDTAKYYEQEYQALAETE